MAAPKPCIHPGCRALVRDGTSRCPEHRKKASNFTKRLSRHERGYGSSWDRLRQVVLQRDGGLCQACLADGFVKPGNLVDHKVPKAEGGTDDLGNLQVLCKVCHDNKTALESARGGRAVAYQPEWLPMPRVPVQAVCGPPGSGKSTYVRERAQPGDLVLDVDEIAVELTRKPLYHATSDEVAAALRVRNKRLADLAAVDCPYPRAWLIVTGSTPEVRDFWARKLGRPVHVLTTTKAEWMERIRADPRRPPAAQRAAIEAVLRWLL